MQQLIIKWSFVPLLFLLCLPQIAFGQQSSTSNQQDSFWEQDTVTNEWFGQKETMAKHGFHPRLRATEIYQYNIHGGMNAGEGAFNSTYDLDLDFDLDTLLNLSDTDLHIRVQGGWREGDGLDTEAVGSVFGINDDRGGERTADITEVRIQKNFLDDRIRLRFGKLDITKGIEVRGVPVAFDAGMYANDERNLFLNSSLVNNPTIPFPSKGIGVELHTIPVEGWYASVAATDADADVRETGINTAFDGDEHYFLIFETGWVPMIQSENGRLPGAYRFGIWNDRQSRPDLDGTGTADDDVGAYLYLEQMVWREPDSQKRPEGLGVFARMGETNEEVRTIDTFASAGFHYQGLFPGRERDKTGIGFAHGHFSDNAGTVTSSEEVVELYHNFRMGGGMEMTPHAQWISDPGGSSSGDDALILGTRLQIEF